MTIERTVKKASIEKETITEIREKQCPYCKQLLQETTTTNLTNGKITPMIGYTGGSKVELREIHDGEVTYRGHDPNRCRAKKLMEAAGFKIRDDVEICLTCAKFEHGIGVDWMENATQHTTCLNYLIRLHYEFDGMNNISPLGWCENWEQRKTPITLNER